MASCAGLVGPIPALHLLGQDYSPWALLLWGLFVGFLGIFFAVPLRKQLLVKDNLRFPSGCATFETISAMMQSGGAEAKARVKWLFNCAAFAAAFTFAAYFLPVLEHPPLIENLGAPGAAAAAFGWKIFLDPMLTGAGALSGIKAGSSMMLGAVLAWGVIGPIVHAAGLAHGSVMGLDTGVRGWLLWPGVTLMLVDSIVTLCLSVPWASLFLCIRRKGPRFSHLKSTSASEGQLDTGSAAESASAPASASTAASEAVEEAENPNAPSFVEPSTAEIDALLEQVCCVKAFASHSQSAHNRHQVPTSWFIVGLCVSTVSCTVVLSTFFGLPPWQVTISTLSARLRNCLSLCSRLSLFLCPSYLPT